MTTVAATITRAFERYVDTFQSLDPKATMHHLHVPSLILDARGPHLLSSEGEAEAFLTTVMRDLAERELERLGETYTLRRTGDDWKIVVAVVHDADGVLTGSCR